MRGNQLIVIKVISVIFVLAGLALLGFGVPEYARTRDFIEKASPAQGTITEVIPRTTRSRKGTASTSYYYRVTYATGYGAAIEFVNGEETASPEFRPGETVPVLFDPGEPSKAAIDSFALLWFDCALLNVLGGFFLATGLCNLWITAVPARGIRNEATLRELKEALLSGKLTRQSRYQGLMVAFTFAGFAFLGAAIMVVFFSSTTARAVIGALAAYGMVQATMGIRQHRKANRAPGR
jgi:hypothetical protein